MFSRGRFFFVNFMPKKNPSSVESLRIFLKGDIKKAPTELANDDIRMDSRPGSTGV